MRPRLPPLNSLRVFEAAARHESFTRAAEELCVTQGAVSHQVKALEADLAIKLPDPIGSPTLLKTTGMVLVAACAALAVAVPKPVIITSGLV